MFCVDIDLCKCLCTWLVLVMYGLMSMGIPMLTLAEGDMICLGDVGSNLQRFVFRVVVTLFRI